MNQPKGKTSVRLTINLTWRARIQLLKMALTRHRTFTFFDDDVKEVLIKEEIQTEKEQENEIQHNP